MSEPKRENNNSFSVFVCGRDRKRPSLPPCGRCAAPRRADLRCAYQLRGTKAGSTCDQLLCANCAKTVNGYPHCPPHARAIETAAATAAALERANTDDEFTAKLRAAYEAEVAKKGQ